MADLPGEFTLHHCPVTALNRKLGLHVAQVAKFDERIADQALALEPMLMQWIAVPGLKCTKPMVWSQRSAPTWNNFFRRTLGISGYDVSGNPERSKQLGGRTRKRNPWLRRTLCEAAWGDSHAKRSYFPRAVRRLYRDRGKKRAIVVAYSLLVTVYSLTKSEKH